MCPGPPAPAPLHTALPLPRMALPGPHVPKEMQFNLNSVQLKLVPGARDHSWPVAPAPDHADGKHPIITEALLSRANLNASPTPTHFGLVDTYTPFTVTAWGWDCRRITHCFPPRLSRPQAILGKKRGHRSVDGSAKAGGRRAWGPKEIIEQKVQ